MLASDVLLKMHIDNEVRERLDWARCAHAARRAKRVRDLIQRMHRVQHDLDSAERRDRVRRGQALSDCG